MMTNPQSSELYWTGGPFQVGLRSQVDTPHYVIDQAVATLDEFCSECHKQYFAFNGMVNGRFLAYKKLKPILKLRDNKITIGAAASLPDAKQLPGKSTIAQMSQGELLEGLKEGGTFEDQHAKALIVMIYHLWEENYRHKIACTMSVSKNQVECILMGDIRRVRNLIIHKTQSFHKISQTNSNCYLRFGILNQEN